jgi:hypothetical protein
MAGGTSPSSTAAAKSWQSVLCVVRLRDQKVGSSRASSIHARTSLGASSSEWMSSPGSLSRHARSANARSCSSAARMRVASLAPRVFAAKLPSTDAPLFMVRIYTCTKVPANRLARSSPEAMKNAGYGFFWLKVPLYLGTLCLFVEARSRNPSALDLRELNLWRSEWRWCRGRRAESCDLDR